MRHPSAAAAGRTVAVCCLTYRRPKGLRRLLEGIAALHPPPGGDTAVRVVVVDNDPAGSAGPVVEGIRTRMPFEMRYVVEARRGIAYGRNRAVRESGDAEHVAFIDDDERPDPDWLIRLLARIEDPAVDVVTGPVLPVFEAEPPRWVTRGAFFERRRHADGERIHYARTSNVLIRRSLLDRRGPEPFDTAFALSGGEDTHFFTWARRSGAGIVWADRAVVSEWVPATRICTRWILMREFRRGITRSQTLRRIRGRGARRAKRLLAASLWISRGLVEVVAAAPRGHEHRVRATGRILFGAGLAAGLAGIVHEEYRTLHGD